MSNISKEIQDMFDDYSSAGKFGPSPYITAFLRAVKEGRINPQALSQFVEDDQNIVSFRANCHTNEGQRNILQLIQS